MFEECPRCSGVGTRVHTIGGRVDYIFHKRGSIPGVERDEYRVCVVDLDARESGSTGV